MTDGDHIRHSAEGMIRNFGDQAAHMAEVIATRHRMPTNEGEILWLAVADEIRKLTQVRSRAAIYVTRAASAPP